LMRHTTAHFVIRNVYVHSGLKGYDSFYGGCDPACADGIELQQVTNGIVEQNILYWNTNGVWLAGSSNITLFGNNFLQNGFPHYSDDNPTANHWDGGYPVGGNYWSSNTGAVDNCSGPSQNVCPDPDGISDSNSGYDRYPLMKPFGDPIVSFNQTFKGLTVSLKGGLDIDPTTRTVSGTITATAVDNATSQTIFSKTFTISFTYNGQRIAFLVTIPSSDGFLAAGCAVRPTDGTFSCSVSVSPDVNHDGAIDILDLAQAAIAFDSVKGDARYSGSCDVNADGSVNILDLAQLAIDYQLPVFS